ncbi:MAG: T9SS type A sorting domain-containing protein [Bacteroidota bacterium]
MKVKKLILFLVLSASYGFGQQLNFAMTSDTLKVLIPNETEFMVTDYLTSSLTNTGTDTLTLDIIRLENELPNQWLSGLCLDVCYLTIVDSIRVSIPPASSKEFKMYFGFMDAPYASTAHTKILFRDISDPANPVLQDYYGRVNGELGLTENLPLAAVKIFPNPASDQVTVSFNNPLPQADFILFDPLGKEVLRKSGWEANELSIDLSQLATGIYTYQLRNKDELFTTGKLNKD